jgi:hypothetical protein
MRAPSEPPPPDRLRLRRVCEATRRSNSRCPQARDFSRAGLADSGFLHRLGAAARNDETSRSEVTPTGSQPGLFVKGERASGRVAQGAAASRASGRGALEDMLREHSREPHPGTGPVRLSVHPFMYNPGQVDEQAAIRAHLLRWRPVSRSSRSRSGSGGRRLGRKSTERGWPTTRAAHGGCACGPRSSRSPTAITWSPPT